MKKRNNKGFTLIELLAVVVILAIIALIATPMILGVIENAKKGAAKSSSQGYIDAVERQIATNLLDNDSSNDITDKVYTVDELTSKGVTIKGELPTSGTVTILNGKIMSTELSFYDYHFMIDSSGKVIEKALVYGLKWDGNDNYTRLEDAKEMTSCVGTDTAGCVSDFDNAEIYREIKEIMVDGNQFIYIPKFYIKKVVSGDTWEWYISKEKKDNSYYLPSCFYDETKNIELSYILVGKYNASLSNDNKLESKTNTIPLVSKNINEFRTYARNNNTSENTGYQLIDIHAVDVLQVLFYIEFGTLNSQSVMMGFSNGQYNASYTIKSVNDNNITLVSGIGTGYKVGQLIDVASSLGGRNVVTNLKITAINGDTLTVEDTIGTQRKANITVGNIVYNVAHLNGNADTIKASSGSIISNTNGKYTMSYRGIENLYGGVWQVVDGVNVDNDTSSIYVAKDASQYQSDLITQPYVKIGYSKLNTEGHVTKMGFDSNNPFIQFPTAVGGNSNSKYGDYYYMNTTAGNRIVMFGGAWSSNVNVGISYFYLGNNSAAAGQHAGTRLLKTPF